MFTANNLSIADNFEIYHDYRYVLIQHMFNFDVSSFTFNNSKKVKNEFNTWAIDSTNGTIKDIIDEGK